jgi:hypothetical protein
MQLLRLSCKATRAAVPCTSKRMHKIAPHAGAALAADARVAYPQPEPHTQGPCPGITELAHATFAMSCLGALLVAGGLPVTLPTTSFTTTPWFWCVTHQNHRLLILATTSAAQHAQHSTTNTNTHARYCTRYTPRSPCCRVRGSKVAAAQSTTEGCLGLLCFHSCQPATHAWCCPALPAAGVAAWRSSWRCC